MKKDRQVNFRYLKNKKSHSDHYRYELLFYLLLPILPFVIFMFMLMLTAPQ